MLQGRTKSYGMVSVSSWLSLKVLLQCVCAAGWNRVSSQQRQCASRGNMSVSLTALLKAYISHAMLSRVFTFKCFILFCYFGSYYKVRQKERSCQFQTFECNILLFPQVHKCALYLVHIKGAKNTSRHWFVHYGPVPGATQETTQGLLLLLCTFLLHGHVAN